MENRKYELTDETIEYKGRILHRILALRDFLYVKQGEHGGWIETEENLSHDGACWVFDNSKVFDCARVYDNAKINNESVVCGNAFVHDSAVITNKSFIKDGVIISGESKIMSTVVYGDISISDLVVGLQANDYLCSILLPDFELVHLYRTPHRDIRTCSVYGTGVILDVLKRLIKNSNKFDWESCENAFNIAESMIKEYAPKQSDVQSKYLYRLKHSHKNS